MAKCMKIYKHVNFLEHVFPIEEIATQALAAGYDGIELRGWDITETLPLDRYLARCIEIAGHRRLELVFGCPNNTTPAGRDESMQRMKSLIRIAGEGGIKILNVFAEYIKGPQTPYHYFELNGSALATDADFTRTADYFREVGELSAQWDILLCFETHNCYLHDLGAPTARLLKLIALDNVKANFDYGNIFLNRSNLGLDRELAELSSHIGYAHLKNVVAFNHYDSRLLRGSSLADGDINTLVTMRKLLSTGFEGPLAIENILPGDKRRWLREDLAYLRSILADIDEIPAAS